MTRRNFLKSLGLTLASLSVIPELKWTENDLDETLSDFERFLIWQMKFHVDNPRSYGIITDIGIE